MPINRKAVAVAKDVIKQLTLKKIKARRGYYFHAKLDKPYKPTDDFKQYVNKICDCEVCALGACFVSKVRLYNDVTMRHLRPSIENKNRISALSSTIRSKLYTIFTAEQLNLIECAFECSTSFGLHTDKYIIATKFGTRYVMPYNRLLAIMRNIIANKGTFDPSVPEKRKRKAVS